jgi:hypothetical protein
LSTPTARTWVSYPSTVRRFPIRPALPLLFVLAACDGATGRDAEVQTFVEQAFATARPSGAVGTEVQGKGVWYRTPVFDGQCLQTKELGIRDQGRGGGAAGEGIRISPRYGHQNDWVLNTDKGFCVYLGESLSMTVKNVTKVGDDWVVDVNYAMGIPGDWWQCIAPDQRDAMVRVKAGADGALVLDSDVGLARGGCPQPLPSDGRTRTATKRPMGKPPKPPTVADARSAMKRLDDALFSGDHTAALAATSCYNLYEEKPYGACSVGEIINVGPIPRGEMQMKDGPPWTMNAFKSVDDIGPIVKDKDDPTMFHVRVAEARGKKRKDRHATLQWADGEYKIVGVVQRLAEGLTSIEYINDLDRKDKRDIFDRRVKGERIGPDGEPVHPDLNLR